MPRIDLCFSGWVRGVEVTEAMNVANFETVVVANMSPGELVGKLQSGELAISLKDCLEADSKAGEIQLFDFAVQGAEPLSEESALPFGGSHAPTCPYHHGGECLCWRSDPEQNPEAR
jgi:hypothetical protein